jgi:hypothetical protein
MTMRPRFLFGCAQKIANQNKSENTSHVMSEWEPVETTDIHRDPVNSGGWVGRYPLTSKLQLLTVCCGWPPAGIGSWQKYKPASADRTLRKCSVCCQSAVTLLRALTMLGGSIPSMAISAKFRNNSIYTS